MPRKDHPGDADVPRNPPSSAPVATAANPLATLEEIATAIPEEFREAWARFEASDHVPTMKRTVARIASGESSRKAAAAEGYEDHAESWRIATKYGLIGAKKSRILAGNRLVALLVNEELERRLVEKTDEISDRDLTVMGGVAQDKLAAAEKKSAEEPSTGGLDALVTKLAEAGYSFEITVKTPDPVLEARAREEIDVTPDR